MAQESRLVIVIDSQNAERNARNLGNELNSIEKNGDFASKSTDRLSVATRQLAGYMAGLVTVGAAVSKMDTYTGLQNRLKLVTSSQVELNQALRDSFNIAQATGQAWDSTAQVYQRFADNAKRLGITLQQTSSLTETVAKAIAISGGSAASAEAALVQFGQALASGVFRGEEFNSIAEQAPGLLKAIATGLDTNIGQLRAMAAEGQLTADVVIKALEKAKVSVDDLFSKTDFTIGNSLTMLNNAITQFIGEAGKGSGAAQTLSGSIQVLANNLDLIANSAFALGIGLMTKAVLTKTVAVQASIAASAQQLIANIAERNANIAATKAEVESAAAEAQSTQVTLTNIKATHAQIMAEIELEKVRLKAQFTDQGRMATTTRMAQLGRLQAQVALEIVAAETAQSASSARLSAALTAQSVATSRLALAKSALMAIFSPMGLAIAATAASFYLLSNSSDEVKESLATQSDSVETLTNKYLELNSVQALVEGVRLRKEIEQQNDAIDDASSATQRFAYIQKELFKLSGNDYADYQKAIKSIATGASDAGDLLRKMIASGRFSQEQIDKLVEYSGAVAESKNKIEQGNNALKLLNATSGQHVEVTADSIKQLTIQTNLTKVATQNFTDMKIQMLDSLRAQVEFIRLNGGSEEQVKSLNKVIQAYSLNQMSATDAVGKFNSTAKVPADTIKGLQDYATKTDQSKTALNQANAELNKQKELRDSYLKQHQSVLAAQQGETNEVNNQVAAQEKLNKLRESYGQRNLEADFITLNTKRFGGDKAGLNKATAVTEFYKENKIPMTRSLSDDEWKIFEKFYNKQVELKKLQDDINDTEKERTKELEKQQKVLTVNAKVQANAAKYGFAGIEAKNNLPSGTLSAIHMIESKGNVKAYNKETGATGGFQFLEGTAKQYGVKDRNDLGQSAEGAGKYMSYLLKLFKGDLEKAVRAYHAGEGNVQKGKGIGKFNNQYWKDFQGYMAGSNGYSTGDISSKDFNKMLEDSAKMAEEQARLRLQLENDVADQTTKIRNDLAKKLEDVDKANFSPERNAEIKAELQRRADNDIAIAKQATRSKLEDYKEFQKTETVLLKENFDRKKFNAAHDIELSKSEQKQAVELLEQQYQQENALMKLAQEQRSFQARLSLLSETQAMQERYRLEREEILKNSKLSIEERQKLIALSKATQDKETRDKVNNAVQNWGGIQADMNGTSEFYRQDQERFSRLGAANDLADSQYAATDLNEQSGLDGLNAQMEAGLIQQQDFENQKTAIIQAAQEQRSQIYNEFAQNTKDIEDKYQQDRLNTQIALGGQMMGSVTSMFGSMFGEQSKAYKLMFAADKAYAIAAAGIAIQQNIAAAAKVGFPYNLPLIAGAVAQGASIIANIRAIKDQGFADGGFTGSGGKYEPAGIVHKGEVVWSQEDIKRWGGVGLVENMRKSSGPEAFINNHATNNTSAENVFNRSFLSSKAFNENQSISNISNFSNPKILNSSVSNSTIQNAKKELLKEVSILKDNGFAGGGYTGRGKKYDIAGAVHKGEIVWSQDDIKKWGGVEKVEQMRRATSPDSFISNYAQNNTSFENVMNRANQSSRAFNQSRDISNIFNQSYQDDQIIYKGNASAANPTTSANSDLYHDGKVYFSSNGLVQDRSNLEDMQDFTSGQSSRPQAEFMPSFEQSSPTINFKIEVMNQVSGATVEAEQLDEKTVRIIVREELDKQLPKAVPRLVSEDIKNPNSLISRSLTENTTARRNRM
ncbi:tape measure protein [Acinetobacter calcoaceticus]|uniref:tape measure protein n=1 Tax=Acinetobacter calcoaceticus TaxID=471 RepID=UPI00192BF1E3|nr:tape measure protein [Acinetobacter calcoaceticus]